MCCIAKNRELADSQQWLNDLISMLESPVSFQHCLFLQSYEMQSTCSGKIQNHDHVREGVTGVALSHQCQDPFLLLVFWKKCVLKLLDSLSRRQSFVTSLNLSCTLLGRNCSAQGQISLCNALVWPVVLIHHHHLDKLKRLCSLLIENWLISSA